MKKTHILFNTMIKKALDNYVKPKKEFSNKERLTVQIGEHVINQIQRELERESK